MVAALVATLLLATGEGPPDRCEALALGEAQRLLETPVRAPDRVSRANGACIFLAADLTRGDELSFNVVEQRDIPAIRANANALARGCNDEARAPACARYRALASVASVGDYFAVRTRAGRRIADAGFPAAIVTDTTSLAEATRVVALAGSRVIEGEVTRDDTFDERRSVELVRIVAAALAR